MRPNRSSLPLFAFAAVCIALLLNSCASTGPFISKEELKRKEEEFNLKFLQASEKWHPRVYRVGYRLITAHVPGLGSETPKVNFTGVGVADLEDYVRKAFHIDKKVSGVLITGIFPGSKAEGLDVKLGDVIEKVDGKKTKNLGAYFKSVRSAKGASVKMDIWRAGGRVSVEAPVEKVFYKAQFFLEPTPNLDASALFSRIDVGIGAIRYCRNDDELALIMGHELAHTTLKHSLKKGGVGLGAAVGYGVLAGTIDALTFQGLGGALTKPMQDATEAAVSRRYEREADYRGMQHAFHAGFDAANGANVFARLATDVPSYAVLAYTFASHPMDYERFARVEKTAEEFKTHFPDRFPMTRSPDWDLVIPVSAGETMEQALQRLVEGKKYDLSAASGSGAPPSVQSDRDLKVELLQAEVDRLRGELERAKGAPPQGVEISLAPALEEKIRPERNVLAVDSAVNASAVGVKTNGTSKATPANPDKYPSSGYPAPKKL